MSEDPGHPYHRKVDSARFAATPPDQRLSQRLIDRSSGATSCIISYIRTPPAGGSPEGMHTHEVDQHFYVLSGAMKIEVDGHTFEAGPGSLVYFPAGVAHRNWNEGDEPTIHLSINAPLPPEGEAFAKPLPA